MDLQYNENYEANDKVLFTAKRFLSMQNDIQLAHHRFCKHLKLQYNVLPMHCCAPKIKYKH